MSDWQPIETAPKDGTDILICMPGGQSDHYYPVCWARMEDWKELVESVWQCRWQLDMILTEEQIKACYLKPMWTTLDVPPSSLCAGPGIKNIPDDAPTWTPSPLERWRLLAVTKPVQLAFILAGVLAAPLVLIRLW